MLLTELSAHFVSVTFDSIDRQIVDAQRRIVQELDSQHASTTREWWRAFCYNP